MVGDGSEFEVGEVTHIGGEHFTYLGKKRWERVEVLAKRFAADDGEMTSGVRAASSRLAAEVG